MKHNIIRDYTTFILHITFECILDTSPDIGEDDILDFPPNGSTSYKKNRKLKKDMVKLAILKINFYTSSEICFILLKENIDVLSTGCHTRVYANLKCKPEPFSKALFPKNACPVTQ